MKRLALVKRVTDERERQQARRLGESESALTVQRAKLQELQTYHADYRAGFAARARGGIGGAGLREFQNFLERLAEAVEQQAQVVARLEAQRDQQLHDWRTAAQRAQMVGNVVKKRELRERHAQDARSQRESDERAQRSSRGDPDAY